MSAGKFEDLTGQKFGKLVVIDRDIKIKYNDVMGNKTFDCFWDCSQCKNNCNKKE